MTNTRSPLAFCTHHGLVPATAFGIGAGAHNIVFKNVSVSCPICGQTSEVIPGVYDFTTERLDVMVDPSISPQALSALKSIAERLQAGRINPEEAANEAAAIDPKFSKALLVAAKIGAWAVTAILALITLYLQIQSNGASSAENAAILEALTKQTAVLEQIAAEMSEEPADSQPETTGKENPKLASEVQPAAEKPKSERREAVNKARRDALRRHREQFQPR